MTPPVPAPTSLDLEPAEFLRAAARVVEWIARYLEEGERFPVLPAVAPGAIAARCRTRRRRRRSRSRTSSTTSSASSCRASRTGTTRASSPTSRSPAPAPGILAEMLAAALNVNAMLWRTSPAATELEQRVLDWLRQMLGLRRAGSGTSTTRRRSRTMLALAAAREAVPDSRSAARHGRTRRPAALRVYASEQAHSSVDKAAIALGFGHENVVHVPVDDAFRMRRRRAGEAIAGDRARGLPAAAVVATVGHHAAPPASTRCRRSPTSAGASGMWLHVDAAYGGVGALVPEMRHTSLGVERADSLVVNPHKWLFTPVDCSAALHAAARRCSACVLAGAGVPRDGRAGAVDEPDGLRRAARAPVPRAQAVDGDARLRRDGLAERLRATSVAWRRSSRDGSTDAPGWELAAPTPSPSCASGPSPPG